jgi:hypothetical protein
MVSLLAKHDPGGGGGFRFPTNDWNSCVENGVARLDCIPLVLQNVVSSFLMFAGAVAVIIVIVSGYKFIMSKGDQKQVHTAKASLTYAILGLVLIILSFFIVQVIAMLTGAECIKIWGFTNCQ